MLRKLSIILVFVIFPTSCSYLNQDLADLNNTRNMVLSSPTISDPFISESPTQTVRSYITPKPKSNAQIGQHVFYVWKELNTFWIYVACEIKNNGSTPLYIGSVNASATAKDDSVLQTVDMIGSIPPIINPDEKAYVSGIETLDNIKEANEVISVEITGSFSTWDKGPVYLKTSQIKFFPSKDKYSSSMVTGWVENTTKESADNVVVVCGLYDIKGNLVGVFRDNVHSIINPGSKAAFKANTIQEPPDLSKNVAKVDAVAIQYSLFD